MANIVLIGYRCTGKTVVGRNLAHQISFDFIDTDDYIEKEAGCSVSEIVAKYGWDKFRRLEKEAIKVISSMDGKVIAAGGGAVLDDQNVKNLRKNAIVILLKAKPQVILDRMVSDKKTEMQRPGLTGKNPFEEIKEVLRARQAFYEKAMDFSVDTTSKNIASIVNEIVKKLRNQKSNGR